MKNFQKEDLVRRRILVRRILVRRILVRRIDEGLLKRQKNK
jgi:hypothetical protein